MCIKGKGPIRQAKRNIRAFKVVLSHGTKHIYPIWFSPHTNSSPPRYSAKWYRHNYIYGKSRIGHRDFDIGLGYGCFQTYEKAVAYSNSMILNCIIVEVIIPKGSRYQHGHIKQGHKGQGHPATRSEQLVLTNNRWGERLTWTEIVDIDR